MIRKLEYVIGSGVRAQAVPILGLTIFVCSFIVGGAIAAPPDGAPATLSELKQQRDKLVQQYAEQREQSRQNDPAFQEAARKSAEVSYDSNASGRAELGGQGKQAAP